MTRSLTFGCSPCRWPCYRSRPPECTQPATGRRAVMSRYTRAPMRTPYTFNTTRVRCGSSPHSKALSSGLDRSCIHLADLTVLYTGAAGQGKTDLAARPSEQTPQTTTHERVGQPKRARMATTELQQASPNPHTYRSPPSELLCL